MQLKSLLFISALIASVAPCGLHSIHSRDYIDPDPQYAPVPAEALGAPIGPGGYGIEAYGNGAYMVTEGMYQAFFLVSSKGVILVDAPPTIGHKLLWAIHNTTSLPITHLIYSHYHSDHIGAATLFPNTTIIAHALTKRNLLSVPHADRPLPTITFTTTYTLNLGNQTLELAYKGEAHVSGNIFIYAPLQKVLILIDVVFPGWVPFASLGIATSVPAYIAAHAQLLAYDFEHYIGGHLGRAGNRSDVEAQQEYVADLKYNSEVSLNTSAGVGLEAVVSQVSATNPNNNWAVFKVYLGEVAEYAANLTNAKWLGVLAGADVYSYDNAWLMIEALRVDYGILGPFGTV